jgi:hypothetical protein
MANIAGDASVINPPKLDEQQVSQPSFPNTRSMKITTDFLNNPGTYDEVFKKIKGIFHFFIDFFSLYENL